MRVIIGLKLLFVLNMRCVVVRCDHHQDAKVFTFDGDVRDFAVVANGSVYVVTEERLFHLSHALSELQSRSQRGRLTPDDTFQRVPEAEGGVRGTTNATFTVNTMVPFVDNGTLIICGETLRGCDYCELLDLRNISRSVHMEKISVGSGPPNDTFTGSLVNVEEVGPAGRRNEVYILAAKKQYTSCGILVDRGIYLHNTNDHQPGQGGIFSETDQIDKPHIWTRPGVNFELLDGFQINSSIYIFSKIPDRENNDGRIRLVWLRSKKDKTDTLKSLRGATLECCADGRARSSLRSSSVVAGGGPRVLWAGVFAARSDDSQRDLKNTALAVFDISPPAANGGTDEDPDFCSICTVVEKGTKPMLLTPENVLFTHKSMTSVLAVRQKSWMVFFIGTGDGQLIKLAVDEAYGTACPRVLFKTDDDRKVFPKIHLDPVDGKHVYVVIRKQMIRVPVSKCEIHKALEACWSAQDPYCGWCDSTNSCTFEDECPDSVWLSIPDDSNEEKIISHRVEKSNGQINLTIQAHLSTSGDVSLLNFACDFTTTLTRAEYVCAPGRGPQFPLCSCSLHSNRLPAEGLLFTVRITLGNTQLTKEVTVTNCSDFSGPPTSVLCHQCIMAGCGWSNNTCSWTNLGANNSVCKTAESGTHDAKPEIVSITPSVVSFHGRNHALLSGRNLGDVTSVRMQADMDCSPKESPVWNNTGFSLTFHIPSADKGVVRICAVLTDGSCHGNASVTYGSVPMCRGITPDTTWASGGRSIMIQGSHLEFVENVLHGDVIQNVSFPPNGGVEVKTLFYDTPPTAAGTPHPVSLKVANETLACKMKVTSHPDPHFINFTSTRTGAHLADLLVTIQKKPDKLNMSVAELSVQAVQGNKQYECVMERMEADFFTCKILHDKKKTDDKIQALQIKYGAVPPFRLENPGSLMKLHLLLLILLPIIIVAAVFLHRNQQKKLTAQMNKRIEDLELDIRNDIRQGFVDLQTEKSDLIENVGTIPFLDYKHFASRIFFPEGGTLATSCIKDIGQDAVQMQPEECCQALSKLIQDQLFLTSMVHALEEQKNFTIKDKCAVASLLTVALHGDLVYLTQVMEDLLRALMEQPSNSHPKLMLRRTESIVEKLLTNWMSICLYGFLRERVGQHLFLLVSALSQQISKGPVDSVTEKALYTLSEEWLLWQAQDFTSVKLKVLFTVGGDGEVSEPLEVTALSCDTVEQLKEKILNTFKAKFGFPYNTALRDVRIELEKDGSFMALEEVDHSSEVLNHMKMLNTLQHYQVPDGASIKVLSKKTRPPLSPQGSLKDDQNFSVKYFHLIDPDVAEDHKGNPERKKLKLKEVHLTKLLSTKVAVHSFVENLFRGIWGTPQGRAPHAIKYFFDFLDAQADVKKITDPDVLHIWKTNSLPLRFWINILKNPQFVFDMEKSPHLDGCLSVIAQAFMDSFSLTETPLGKHAPTNKLLYAKDMPQFRQEVKAFYKQVRDQPPISSSEFNSFLMEESKKHENEFNESAALRELYKFLEKYFAEVKQKLDQNGAPAELMEQLQHVKDQFDGLKSCSWN